MDLPFLFEYSLKFEESPPSFNPYSNGSSFFILVKGKIVVEEEKVSILILMDLPFLCNIGGSDTPLLSGFNPYSNGSSFFI